MTMKKTLLICSVIAASSIAASADCYIVGNVNNLSWDPSTGVQMNDKGNDVYEINATINSVNNGYGYFCLASSLASPGDWSTFNSTYRLSPATKDFPVTLDTPMTLNRGIDASFMIAGGEYTFIADLNAMTLTVSGKATDPMADIDYYGVIGTFGDWQENNSVKMDYNRGIYTTSLTDFSGGYKIIGHSSKVGYTWDVNFGSVYPYDWDSSNTYSYVMPEGQFVEAMFDGGNFLVNDDENIAVEKYNIAFTRGDGKNVVYVTTGDKLPIVYQLVGSINDWNTASTTYNFTTTDGDIWTLHMERLSGEFKIIGNSTYAAGFGQTFTDELLTLGSPIEITPDGNNFVVDGEMENVDVVLNLTTNQISLMTADDPNSVSTVGAIAKGVDVYNAAGIRVASGICSDQVNNLPKGLYIVGGKKVVIK